ncbi:MAG: hypothetical protein ACLPT4_07730 [Verrucomicrobiia bacterium]
MGPVGTGGSGGGTPARAYETEEHRARNLHLTDSHACTDEKSARIRATESTALTWFAKHHPAPYSGQISNGDMLDSIADYRPAGRTVTLA